MKTTLTRESASKVHLAVEASSDEVRPALDRAVRALANEVKIPGFRKGKIPRQILENKLGRDAVKEAALREAIPELLAKAVEEETLLPVSTPSVEVRSYELDADLAFDATVEVRPDIELPELSELTAQRPQTAATAEEIDDQLERVRNRFATLETVERPAQNGDFVLMDLKTTLHTQAIDELSGTDELYEVGSDGLVSELDTQLLGKKAGDILQFNATLPETGPQEWAGKEVTFQVLVKEVRRKLLPDLDDELAKTASEFETLDELRTDLAERIEKVKSVQADTEVRNRLLEALLDEVDVDVPESLVHQEMAFRLQRFEDQLRMSGLSLEQYIESQGFSEDQIESDLRRQAERNVRAQLVLEEIGRREGFSFTEEELRDEVRYHAEVMRVDVSTLAKQLGERGRLASLAGDIIRRKALNHLVEKADIQQEASTDEAEESQS